LFEACQYNFKLNEDKDIQAVDETRDAQVSAILFDPEAEFDYLRD